MSEYKDRHEDDWSGRHVRIRFEMVLSALAFVIFARYGAEEIRLPIVGTKSVLSDDFLMWASLVFCIFAIVSLLARSHYEKMRWPKEELSNKKEIDILERDFLEIKAASNALKFSENDDSKVTFKKLCEESDDIQQLNLKSIRFLQFLSDLFSEEGMNSPVHPKFWAKTVPLMAQVNSASNALSRNSTNAVNAKNSQSVVHPPYDKMHSEVRDAFSKLVDGLNALEPEIVERKSALVKIAFTKVFQRELLSYGFPILTAISLLIFGFYSRFCVCPT